MNTTAPSKSQPAPRSCLNCSGRGRIAVAGYRAPEYVACPAGCLDEEDANDIATFFVGGMANRVAIESALSMKEAA